jgi:hypothetical protein
MVSATVTRLQMALKGEVSKELRNDIDKLVGDEIPEKWERIYPDGSNKPLQFIASLGEKLKYVFGQTHLGDVIDIRKLFRPSALIISLEQKLSKGEHAKIIKFSTTGQIKLNGLYLMGADFDTRVHPAKIESTVLVQLPPLSISFIPMDQDISTLPMYNKTERLNHISKAVLPGLDVGNKNWLLNGAAIFLNPT